MKLLALFLAGVFAATSVCAKEWVFTGSVRGKTEWQRSGANWATVFVKVDSGDVLLDEIRLIYNPTNGVLNLEDSCWMGKPMPKLRCPRTIAALVSAKDGIRCKLIFESEQWDLDAKDKGKITLKSLEWIQDVQQDGADQPATAPESKAEGKEKTKPKSEVRPQ
jgi:hypothetical protein